MKTLAIHLAPNEPSPSIQAASDSRISKKTLDTPAHRADCPSDPLLAELLTLLREIRDVVARPALQERLAVDAPTLAALLSISERTVWSLSAANQLPPPIKLAGRTVWHVESIRKHLADMVARTTRRR